jgi:hypothetical protein
MTDEPPVDLLVNARRLFTMTEARDWERFIALIHPDAVIALRSQPGRVLHGREEVLDYVSSVVSTRRVHEVTVDVLEQLAGNAVVALGRLFVADERGVMDAAVGWLMLFEDGMLRRSWLVDSVADARRKLDEQSALTPT